MILFEELLVLLVLFFLLLSWVLTLSQEWWWLVIPMTAFFVLSEWWLLYVQSKFIKSIKWILLEFLVPKENLKSPKAMEQVFASLHATYSFGILFWQKWFHGRVEEWMAIEMAGFGEGVHFYMRIPEKYRNLVETALFSQYPDAEIHEAEDYTDRFGIDLPNDKYDIFGADFILGKANPYPIRTYPHFEEQVEERRVDPIAAIAEVMSNLKDDEMVWIQLLIRPTGDGWKRESKPIIDEITGREKKEERNVFLEGLYFIRNLIYAFFTPPTWGEAEAEGAAAPQQKRLTPGEMDVLKAVENKVSKLGFETIMRFLYIDSKESFTDENVSAVMGAIRQFNTLNLNAFRPTLVTMTIPVFLFNFLFKQRRLLKRKKTIFANYRNRFFPLLVKPPILNIEELATVYHPPITAVGAPKLWRLETRKGEPPPNLPVV